MYLTADLLEHTDGQMFPNQNCFFYKENAAYHEDRNLMAHIVKELRTIMTEIIVDGCKRKSEWMPKCKKV